jgi:hypothetical protein
MQVMKTKATHISARLALLLLALFATSINNPSMAQTGCSLINKQRPAQFIDYQGVSSFREVKLRLRNNTNCTIIVETDDHYPTRMVKQPNGGFKLEGVTDSQDGIRLDLHYLIHNRLQQTLKVGYGGGDTILTYEILAGQSVLFNVPLSSFRKQLDIAVPFNYSWDGDGIGMGAGGTVHRVYFLFDDLPKTVLQTARSN